MKKRSEWKLGGVYLVTSMKRPVSRLVDIVTAALEGGVSMVQFRDKGEYPNQERTEAARGIRSVCNHHGVPFLVNDDPAFARRVGADGVHVGRDDPSPREASAVLGEHAVVGATVYGSPEEEAAAEAAGADYIAVGTFFPSPTKPEKAPLPLSVLDEVVARSRLPVFAIGGITADQARILANHGVAGVAVVSAIMDADDPQWAAEQIVRAFQRGP
ncbi:MAG: thiamine phosphate synthase [Thermoplasmata archaeon]